MTLGRFSPEKNQHGLITALREIRDSGRLDDWHFMLVGEGPLERELRSAIADCRLDDRVFLHEAVANPAQLYRAADLVVVPSLHEGMPNVALRPSSVST